LSDLRNLAFSIGWNINDSALRQSDAMTDMYRDNVLGLQTNIEDLGNASEMTATQLTDGMRDAGSEMQLFGDTSELASSQIVDTMGEAHHEMKELGEQTRRSAEDMNRELGEVNSTLSEMVGHAQEAFNTLKGGIAALIAGGVLGFFTNAAAGAEATELRFRWFASESEGALEKLNNAMDTTIEMSHGLLTGGELQAASIQAMQLGASADFISEHMQGAAIISAKSGQDIGNVFSQLSRAVEMGNIKPLRELGIITDEHFSMIGERVTNSIADWDRSKREMLVYAATQDLVNQNMGMYNEYLDTSEAQTKIFTNQLGEVVETMGGPLLRPLTQVLWGFSSLFKEIKNNPIGNFALQALGWIVALTSLGVGLMAVGKAFGFLRTMFLPMILPFVKFIAIATAIYLVVEDLIFAFGGFGDSVTENLFNAAMEFLGFDYTFQEFREGLISGLKIIGDWFVGIWVDIKEAWQSGEGFLGNALHGIVQMAKGQLIMMANMFKMAFGLIWGIFTGDWTMLQEGFQGLVDGIGEYWAGLTRLLKVPLEQGKELLVDFKDFALQKLDDLIQGFLNMPGTIMAGIEGFGSQLKDKLCEQLSDVRRLLPFSPAKEGPLVDLHESGENIIGNIQEGIERAKALNISGKLAPAVEQADEPSLVSSPRMAQVSRGNDTFSPTIQITISGGSTTDIEEQMRQAKEAAKREFLPMLEEYFRMLQRKVPMTTEV